MPKLYIADPEGETVYEIFDDEVSLGRGAANGIQLNDSGASKSHAVVRRMHGYWKVVDLESKNGVRVNGRFRNQHWLSDGDQLIIGSTGLRYAAEGAGQGSPAAAAAATAVAVGGVAAEPRVVAARAVPAKAPPAAPVVSGQVVSAQAVPAQAAPAPAAPERSAPAPAPSRRAAPSSSARRRRERYDDEGYDSEYDDLPPVRRKSNSTSIVIFGIIGAVALIGFFWLISSGGTPHNQLVWREAGKLADGGKYEEALRYAETNADPDGADYHLVVKAMNKYKETAKASAFNARSKEARDYFDYQIWRKQSVEGTGFRAKDALSDEEVVRLLREFLVKYKGTGAAASLLNSDYEGRPALRAAMREYALEDLKAMQVLGPARSEIGILIAHGQFGQAVIDLVYLRDMNRLTMTPENWKELRSQVDGEIEEIKSKARLAFKKDRTDFRTYNQNAQRGMVLRQLSKMKEQYNGIAELSRGVKELEAEIR